MNLNIKMLGFELGSHVQIKPINPTCIVTLPNLAKCVRSYRGMQQSVLLTDCFVSHSGWSEAHDVLDPQKHSREKAPKSYPDRRSH